MAPLASLLSCSCHPPCSLLSRSRPSPVRHPICLDPGFRGHREQLLLDASCPRYRSCQTSSRTLMRASQRSWLVVSLRSFARSGFMILVGKDMESFVDLAWNQNANTRQALTPSVSKLALRLTPAKPQHTLWQGSRCPRHLLQIPVVGVVVRQLVPFQQWSRHEAWRQNSQARLDLSQELREALLVHGVTCVRF